MKYKMETERESCQKDGEGKTMEKGRKLKGEKQVDMKMAKEYLTFSNSVKQQAQIKGLRIPLMGLLHLIYNFPRIKKRLSVFSSHKTFHFIFLFS